jgi:uncharacterized protein (DUF1501 family)
MAAFSRRQFLQASGATAALASCPGMAFAQGIGTSAPFPDYKALVCIFMFGGNDSYNMLVPRSAAEYNVYATSRQNLAIDQNVLLAINPVTPDGAQYGLHPSMPGLQSLFESNRLAVVSNVGALIEPTTKDQFFNQSVALPPQLFSHNDQQDQWHSLKGNGQSKTGWAGRVADLIRTNVAGQQMATNASLFGNSLFQSADATIAYVMGPTGPIQFEGFASEGILLEQRLAFERVINASQSTVYERGFAEIQRRAVSSAELVSNAITGAPVLTTQFPATQLGNQLRTVAQLIAVRDQLQMQRQVFFVATGGFDTHDNQLQDQPGLLGGISEAMSAFYNASVEIGAADLVTTFTQSDFSRTLTSNGDGSDHAWGGNHLVMGDAVRGRDIYGTFPRLEIDGPDDVTGGRMIPTTSSDQYAATLSQWFGIPDQELDIVAPNIGNFAVRNLGFMI